MLLWWQGHILQFLKAGYSPVKHVSVIRMQRCLLVLNGVINNAHFIAVLRILETVLTFHFCGGKVYSLNKGCHTYVIKHTMHV